MKSIWLSIWRVLGDVISAKVAGVAWSIMHFEPLSLDELVMTMIY